MSKEDLLRTWLEEEKAAHIHGWDFSHIRGRYEEENDLPWDYYKIIMQYLSPNKRLLDIDTGGAEFLLLIKLVQKMTGNWLNYFSLKFWSFHFQTNICQ
ncbi:hypothetical protein [Kineothrix sp. MB12-C1]|uniref:hypothetical protein n=1 Tax=Kineothrix sp. MB12-C1 TaxID=3070215 RepID=UPI0027D34177|nr:hypothetical protein [Kineothrix sp. MB12-C1]WMC91913.1 hypothetical protein RBB56_13705 [Kineothrix sp. MB12-C1]